MIRRTTPRDAGLSIRLRPFLALLLLLFAEPGATRTTAGCARARRLLREGPERLARAGLLRGDRQGREGRPRAGLRRARRARQRSRGREHPVRDRLQLEGVHGRRARATGRCGAAVLGRPGDRPPAVVPPVRSVGHAGDARARSALASERSRHLFRGPSLVRHRLQRRGGRASRALPPAGVSLPRWVRLLEPDVHRGRRGPARGERAGLARLHAGAFLPAAGDDPDGRLHAHAGRPRQRGHAAQERARRGRPDRVVQLGRHGRRGRRHLLRPRHVALAHRAARRGASTTGYPSSGRRTRARCGA